MGNDPILRVLEGTKLPDKVVASLKELLPNYRLEYYSETPNFRDSVKKRIESLYDAFLFFINAYPLNPKFTPLNIKTIKEHVGHCKARCNLNLDSLEDLREELKLFSASVIDVISVAWEWPTGKNVDEAIKCLNEAEQYLLMSRGCPSLATITPSQFGKSTDYIITLDETIPAHYPQLINELLAIKSLNCPKTPSWYSSLAEYKKAYFCNLSAEITTPEQAREHLDSFKLLWRKDKESSFNHLKDLERIAKDIRPLPQWFEALRQSNNSKDVPISEMVKVLSGAAPKTFDQELQNFNDWINTNSKSLANTMSLIAKLPQWYWELPEKQQYFLQSILQKSTTVDDLKSHFSFLPSRLRTIPAPANFGSHEIIRMSADGVHNPLFGKRFRSSHIASRDALEAPRAVQNRHSDSNLAKVTEQAKSDQLILVETLISPIYAKEYIPSVVTGFLPKPPPDLELYNLAREAVGRQNKRDKIFQHNHPYNVVKYIYYTDKNDADSLKLIAAAEHALPSKPELKELILNYKNALDSPILSATFRDYDGRELFLSSIEQLIILTLGGFSYGSCVSGKDRKAIELIHTDAMIIFHEKYKRWPQYGDAQDSNDRALFIKEIKSLWDTGHAHKRAGHNAPGSDGIKTPYWYWPKDIVTAITRYMGNGDTLTFDDRLATDNEVGKIDSKLTKKLLPKHQLRCNLMAKQLGEINCTKLYDALSPLINEKRQFDSESRWIPSLFAAPPVSINEIRSFMTKRDSGFTNSQRLAGIIAKVLNGAEDSKDSPNTPAKTIRNTLRSLVRPVEHEGQLQEHVDKGVALWNDLFNKSKAEFTMQPSGHK